MRSQVARTIITIKFRVEEIGYKFLKSIVRYFVSKLTLS